MLAIHFRSLFVAFAAIAGLQATISFAADKVVERKSQGGFYDPGTASIDVQLRSSYTSISKAPCKSFAYVNGLSWYKDRAPEMQDSVML